MRSEIKLILTGALLAALFAPALGPAPVRADPAKGIACFVAGDAWGGYRTGNNWSCYGSFSNDLSQRQAHSHGTYVNRTSREVASQFITPGFGWPMGKEVHGFSHYMNATVFDPDFAAVGGVPGDDPRFTWTMYNNSLPGADGGDLTYTGPGDRNYVRETWFVDDGRRHAMYEASWPTNTGIDITMRVHSFTLGWGHLDDFLICEFDFYNTGEADVNGDGVVDLHGNRIEALTMDRWGSPFNFIINVAGRRSYAYSNTRYIAKGYDATPDENGYPWAIGFEARGSDAGREDQPGLGSRGFYYDSYYGYTYLGAKEIDPATGDIIGDKKTIFGTPAVGEGEQRGWFFTWNDGKNGINDLSPKGMFICSMGTYFKDGGKGGSQVSLDLGPNPNLFASGSKFDEAWSFDDWVTKPEAEWQRPDGSNAITGEVGDPWEKISLDGRMIEPDEIKAGTITHYTFSGDDPNMCIGPFSLEVGERIRIYFVEAAGYRILGLRDAVKAARAAYASMDIHGEYHLPQQPAAPDMKIDVSENTRPLIKWEKVDDVDGYRIYKSAAWPPYDPTEEGFRASQHYFEADAPGEETYKYPLNPYFSDFADVKLQQGEWWGPYKLLAVIPNSDLDKYANTGPDKGTYPYAYEDNSPGTLPGFTFYYYVAAYKNVSGSFGDLGSYSRLESGKVNFNGRTGLWENTYPWATSNAWFPEPSDVEGRKNIGAPFVLVSPPQAYSDLKTGAVKISVRPNPYKKAAFHDVGTEHKVFFFNLPQYCKISIFDVSGQLIDVIDFVASDPTNGTTFWDMFSKDGIEVGSGVYIWVAEWRDPASGIKGKQSGAFAILR